MIDYKHQACRYVFFATEGDIRKWSRYDRKTKFKKILRDFKFTLPYKKDI